MDEWLDRGRGAGPKPLLLLVSAFASRGDDTGEWRGETAPPPDNRRSFTSRCIAASDALMCCSLLDGGTCCCSLLEGLPVRRACDDHCSWLRAVPSCAPNKA